MSNAPFAPAFVPWQEDFTLVEWDQRGAGGTFGRNGAEKTGALSIDRLVRDGIELTEYLRTYLEKRQIVVFALSFGSVIGLRMVYERSDPRGRECRSDSGTRRNGTATVGRREDAKCGQRLGHAHDEGERPREQDERAGDAEGAPGYSDADLKNLVAGMTFSTEPLVRDVISFDARTLGRSPIPVFIFQGIDDLKTPTPLVERWFANLDAPAKAIVIVEHASHGVFYTHAAELGRFLSERVHAVTIGK